MFLRPVYWPIWQAVLSIIQPDIYPNENFKYIIKVRFYLDSMLGLNFVFRKVKK